MFGSSSENTGKVFNAMSSESAVWYRWTMCVCIACKALIRPYQQWDSIICPGGSSKLNQHCVDDCVGVSAHFIIGYLHQGAYIDCNHFLGPCFVTGGSHDS